MEGLFHDIFKGSQMWVLQLEEAKNGWEIPHPRSYKCGCSLVHAD